MELIDFPGLNCYYNCIITTAAMLGVNWLPAFATLWSETDFKYDPFRKTYLTRRMLTRLSALGARLEMLPCDSPEEAGESISQLIPGEYFLVGMDAFFIPWNPLYGLQHGPHYFIAANGAEQPLCFDPTYGRAGESLPWQSLSSHAFDLSRIHHAAPQPLPTDVVFCVRQEVKRVSKIHSAMRLALPTWLESCLDQRREQADRLARYVDALLHNRYLYRYYLQENGLLSGPFASLLCKEFFSVWTAVKNGLYKASLSPHNGPILDEIHTLFDSLLHQELSAATTILSLPALP